MIELFEDDVLPSGLLDAVRAGRQTDQHGGHRLVQLGGIDVGAETPPQLDRVVADRRSDGRVGGRRGAVDEMSEQVGEVVERVARSGVVDVEHARDPLAVEHELGFVQVAVDDRATPGADAVLRGLRGAPDLKAATEYLRDLQFALGIVEDLDLNTRIWSKQ